jgi:tetratricopeptide (TPR) repeat protein
MLQYFPAIYPGWYTEGFAELIASSQELDDGRIGYGMPAKQRGNEIAAYWVPLTELLTKEKVSVDRYAQGWALTHFFTFNKDRAAQLRAYLTAISSGKTHAQAAQVFGDLNALNREARRYVTTGTFEYKAVKTEIAAPVIKRTRNLSAGEAALIDETIALRDDELSVYRKAGARKQEENLRRANLAKVRSTSLRFPNDPFALYLLSESEFAFDNFAQAEAAADRLLVVSPNHVPGLARKSILLSMAAAKLSGSQRDAKAREARQLAAKANRLDKLSPMPLLAYYQSYHLAGEKPPQIAVEGLTQAVTMLPRNNSVRQLLVDQLARELRYDEAIAWLLPIANSPHDSPRRDAARQLREKLEASRSQGKAAG